MRQKYRSTWMLAALSAVTMSLAACEKSVQTGTPDNATSTATAESGTDDGSQLILDQIAGKRWSLAEKKPGKEDGFQGSGTLTLAQASNDNAMKFENSQLIIRCPAVWGGPHNQVWSASIALPFAIAYESASKERGTMVVEVDDKEFNAKQFSASSFDLVPEEAEAFRDAVLNGKMLTFSMQTVDGKKGSSTVTLTDTASLKAYFAEHCDLKG